MHQPYSARLMRASVVRLVVVLFHVGFCGQPDTEPQPDLPYPSPVYGLVYPLDGLYEPIAAVCTNPQHLQSPGTTTLGDFKSSSARLGAANFVESILHGMKVEVEFHAYENDQNPAPRASLQLPSTAPNNRLRRTVLARRMASRLAAPAPSAEFMWIRNEGRFFPANGTPAFSVSVDICLSPDLTLVPGSALWGTFISKVVSDDDQGIMAVAGTFLAVQLDQVPDFQGMFYIDAADQAVTGKARPFIVQYGDFTQSQGSVPVPAIYISRTLAESGAPIQGVFAPAGISPFVERPFAEGNFAFWSLSPSGRVYSGMFRKSESGTSDGTAQVALIPSAVETTYSSAHGVSAPARRSRSAMDAIALRLRPLTEAGDEECAACLKPINDVVRTPYGKSFCKSCLPQMIGTKRHRNTKEYECTLCLNVMIYGLVQTSYGNVFCEGCVAICA